MKQLKKTILTLVALLAVTTGAWADETPLVTIENKDYPSFTSGNMTFDDKVTVTFSNTSMATPSPVASSTPQTASQVLATPLRERAPRSISLEGMSSPMLKNQ